MTNELIVDLDLPEMYLGNKSKEFFIRIMSNLNSTSYYTDENGYRIRTHHFNKSMPLGFNLKPVTTTIGV